MRRAGGQMMYIFFIHGSEGGDPAYDRRKIDRIRCGWKKILFPLIGFAETETAMGECIKKLYDVFFWVTTHPPGSFVRFGLRMDGVRRAFGADAVFFQKILEIGSLQARGL